MGFYIPEDAFFMQIFVFLLPISILAAKGWGRGR
jgi:hypothetical protein